jgi:hypothetical protein
MTYYGTKTYDPKNSGDAAELRRIGVDPEKLTGTVMIPYKPVRQMKKYAKEANPCSK